MNYNYAISDNELYLDNYNYIKYKNKYIYYHIDLPTYHNHINGKQIIVLGFAYRIDKVTDNLVSELSSFEKVLERLSGKFLIIYDDNIYNDFYNSFDVFFSKKLRLITNDINLIDSEIQYKFLNEEEDKLDNIFFNISPFLPHKHIYRLPFGLSLNIENYRLSFISLISKSYNTISIEEMVNMLRESYPYIIKNISNKFPICLSLSAGIDSRACLELMLEHNYKFIIINWDRNDNNVPDKIIPRIICDKYQLNLIEMKEFDPKYIVTVGYDFDIFNSALKDRKNYRFCKTEEEILDLYIPNNNKIFRKNRKFYNLYIKHLLKNLHIFDRLQFYFYVGNCVAPMMKVDSINGMNCITLFNNYKICKYMLQLFKYRLHEVSLRICENNPYLWNLPFNSLNKNESDKKIEALTWSLHNTFLLNDGCDT